MVIRFVIKEKKASFFYADDLGDVRLNVRVERNEVTACLLPNSIVSLEGEYRNICGASYKEFIATEILLETYANTDKKRVIVDYETTKIGDLIDDSPIMSFGQEFVKSGKKVCFAYFSLKR